MSREAIMTELELENLNKITEIQSGALFQFVYEVAVAIVMVLAMLGDSEMSSDVETYLIWLLVGNGIFCLAKMFVFCLKTRDPDEIEGHQVNTLVA